MIALGSARRARAARVGVPADEQRRAHEPPTGQHRPGRRAAVRPAVDRQRAAAPRRGRADVRRTEARATQAGGPGRLRHKRRDAAGPASSACPTAIADDSATTFAAALGDALVGHEVAGPGFLNLVLSDGWHRDAVRRVLGAGEAFGGGGALTPERSCSSSSPRTRRGRSSPRAAATPHTVTRSRGSWPTMATRSAPSTTSTTPAARSGAWVSRCARARVAGTFPRTAIRAITCSSSRAVDARRREDPRRSMSSRLGAVRSCSRRSRRRSSATACRFDAFFSERTLHEGTPSGVRRAIEMLEDAGHVYRSEGAVWLRTTTFGDDKDRVLIRSSGEPTYFAGDSPTPGQARPRLGAPAVAARLRPSRHTCAS